MGVMVPMQLNDGIAPQEWGRRSGGGLLRRLAGGNLLEDSGSLPMRRVGHEPMTAEGEEDDCDCECFGADAVWRRTGRRICFYAFWAGGCGSSGVGADAAGRER
jgi:hypothetical protein